MIYQLTTMNHPGYGRYTWFGPQDFFAVQYRFDDAIETSAEEILRRCDAAGIAYREATHECGGKAPNDQIWLITVPDDPDAAFAWKCFVQP